MRKLALLALLASTAHADVGFTGLGNQFEGFPSQRYCRFEEGEYRASSGTLSTSGDPFFNSSTGTGATLEEAVVYTAPNGTTVWGAVRQELGTQTTNDSGVRTATQLGRTGSGAIHFRMDGRELAVSDGTNTFITRIGMVDADGDGTDGLYFEYTHSVNSGEWLAVARDASSETTTDTNVVFTAGTNRIFTIDVNAAGTSVVFKIDGTTVHTETGANIPDATDYFGFGAASVRSAGTADNINPIAIDYISYQIPLTVPRC